MLKANFETQIRPSRALLPIRARNLSITRNGRALLNVPEFNVPVEGTLALLGHNGAGKTLLLKVLAGLDAPDTGTVTWGGEAPDRDRALKLGFLLQRPVLLRRSVLANVQYPLAIMGCDPVEQKQRALAELERWKLAHLAAMPARVLSGGEQRRVAIARALITRPECLFLDEPTANLDPQATAAIEDMIARTRDEGIPVILITHDIGQARRLADEAVLMSDGRIAEHAPAGPFFKAPRSAEAIAFLSGHLLP